MHRIRAAIASAFVAVPLLPAPAHAGENFAGFVFSSDRDGDGEIYRVLPDGRTVQLTDNDVHDDDAVWSPDGRRLAFVSDRDGEDHRHAHLRRSALLTLTSPAGGVNRSRLASDGRGHDRQNPRPAPALLQVFDRGRSPSQRPGSGKVRGRDAE